MASKKASTDVPVERLVKSLSSSERTEEFEFEGRKITGVVFVGEWRSYNIYKDSKLIICGICGNMCPEENYLNNDCPTCLMGIDYECGGKMDEIDEDLKEIREWMDSY